MIILKVQNAAAHGIILSMPVCDNIIRRRHNFTVFIFQLLSTLRRTSSDSDYNKWLITITMIPLNVFQNKLTMFLADFPTRNIQQGKVRPWEWTWRVLLVLIPSLFSVKSSKSTFLEKKNVYFVWQRSSGHSEMCQATDSLRFSAKQKQKLYETDDMKLYETDVCFHDPKTAQLFPLTGWGGGSLKQQIWRDGNRFVIM